MLNKNREKNTLSNNPTDDERHELLEKILAMRGRAEDLPDIIEMFSPPDDITTICPSGYCKTKNIRIGIIGAGISGFAAAYELRKLGVDITILEASDRFGGRIETHFFDKTKKYHCELGAMRIAPSHECMWHYINKFKIDTRPFIYKNLNGFTYIKGVRLRGDIQGKEAMKKIYPMFDLKKWEKNIHWTQMLGDTLGRPIDSLTSEERRDILSIRPEYSYRYNALCQFSLRQMLRRGYLSEGGIDLLCSFSPFLRYLQPYSYSETLHDEYPVHFSSLYEPVERFCVFIDRFMDALISKDHYSYRESAEQLGNVEIRKNSPVVGIYWNENSSKVTLKSKYNEVTQTDEFDYIINTVPFTVLRNIDMTPLKSNIVNQAIKELNYIDAIKIYILYKRRFWEDLDIITGTSLTDLTNGFIYYPTDHYYSGVKDPNEPGVLGACYVLALEASKLGALNPDNIINLLNRNLEKVHDLPDGYLDNLVLDYRIRHWGTTKWMGGALTFFNPGQKRVFLESLLHPEYGGRMYFAGEHVSTTHGWAQGSLESALRVSNKIAAQLKDIGKNN